MADPQNREIYSTPAVNQVKPLSPWKALLGWVVVDTVATVVAAAAVGVVALAVFGRKKDVPSMQPQAEPRSEPPRPYGRVFQHATNSDPKHSVLCPGAKGGPCPYNAWLESGNVTGLCTGCSTRPLESNPVTKAGSLTGPSIYKEFRP